MPCRVDERLAEDGALLRVVDRRLEASLRRAGRERGDRDAALVEDVEEVREPPAPLAEQVRLGHAHVLEGERMRVGGVPADLVVGAPRR